jgi:hypothetical protein
MICNMGNSSPGMNREGDEPVAWLYCSCEQQYQIWGEFWWTGEKHDWIFFDDREWSETYTEQLTQCPACEQRLERENLGRMTYQA